MGKNKHLTFGKRAFNIRREVCPHPTQPLRYATALFCLFLKSSKAFSVSLNTSLRATFFEVFSNYFLLTGNFMYIFTVKKFVSVNSCWFFRAHKILLDLKISFCCVDIKCSHSSLSLLFRSFTGTAYFHYTEHKKSAIIKDKD